MLNALFAFLHFAAAFTIVFCLAVEAVTLKETMTASEMRRLQRCDIVYGLSAASVLVVGLLRVFFFEKGSAFYFNQPFFYIKIVAYVVLGLLSIYPTVQFIRWGKLAKGQANITPPSEAYQKARRIVRIEIALLSLVVLSATLMARAVGI